MSYRRKKRHKYLDRPFAFGKKARIERYNTLKTGLDTASRELAHALPQCSVLLHRVDLDNSFSKGTTNLSNKFCDVSVGLNWLYWLPLCSFVAFACNYRAINLPQSECNET